MEYDEIVFTNKFFVDAPVVSYSLFSAMARFCYGNVSLKELFSLRLVITSDRQIQKLVSFQAAIRRSGSLHREH